MTTRSKPDADDKDRDELDEKKDRDDVDEKKPRLRVDEGLSAPQASPGDQPASKTPVDILVTGDDRTATVETTYDGPLEFRIWLNGAWFEQVGEQDGKRVYAPTR